MNIELKPCPFCGGKAEARISPNSRSEEGESFYEVRCKKCGVHVTGKSFNFWTVEYNAEKPQDLLSAVECWNKRAYEEDGRKTGEWITEEIGLMSYATKCSVCGTTLHEGHGFGNAKEYTEYINEFCMLDKFCHECGAKMEGVEE